MSVFTLSAFADEASPILSEQIAALRKNGIRKIEMRGVDGKSVKDLTFDEALRVREALDRGGVSLSSMGSPFGKIGICDDFGAHMDQFNHALDICRILNCDMMRIFSFYMPKGEDPEKYRGEVVRRLDMMLDAAEREGIKLAHENEKGIYGDTGDRCLILMEEFGDRLGLIFDPANFIQVGDSPAEQFPKLEGYLTYMHIKDAIMADGSVVPSGCGDGEIKQIISAIALSRRDMVLSIEPHLTVFQGLENLQDEKLTHKFAYPDSATAFAAASDAIKNILTEIGCKEGDGKWTL